MITARLYQLRVEAATPIPKSPNHAYSELGLTLGSNCGRILSLLERRVFHDEKENEETNEMLTQAICDNLSTLTRLLTLIGVTLPKAFEVSIEHIEQCAGISATYKPLLEEGVPF